MVYLACQHAIKMVVMWYDRVVSSFERFEWLDLAHESFKGGYHPIILHHNHFKSILAHKVNHYKLLANQAWHKQL